ncbi:hypothetical protein [Xanthomonas oryzae]|nr:hypothetical protein [Xanthomonas oryzae]
MKTAGVAGRRLRAPVSTQRIAEAVVGSMLPLLSSVTQAPSLALH